MTLVALFYKMKNIYSFALSNCACYGIMFQVIYLWLFPSRLKCGEFLLLLIGNMHERARSPVFDKIKGLLGEICASLIWSASKFGSTLEPEQRLIALNIQAHRVLECLELNWWVLPIVIVSTSNSIHYYCVSLWIDLSLSDICTWRRQLNPKRLESIGWER